MKAKGKFNRLARDCDEILKTFDEDCLVMSAMAEVTQKETDKFYKGLERGGMDPDELTDHENDIRAVAFAMGFLFGSGQIALGRNKACIRAAKQLSKLFEQAEQ